MENQVDEFVIKNPKWVFGLIIGLLIFELCGAVVLTVLYFMQVIVLGVLWPFLMFIAVLLLPTAFLIYGCLKEKFIYKDETLTYIKIIKKKQSVKIEDLAYVTISCNLGIIMHVKMYDREGKIAISFLEDGTFMRNGLFMKLMGQKNIPVRICY